MESTRFPGKVLADLRGKPVLRHVIERVQQSAVDGVIVATTVRPKDDAVDEFVREMGVKSFRGDVDDVRNRMIGAALTAAADVEFVVRICADCPYIEANRIDELLGHAERRNADYYGFRRPDGLPAVLTHQGLPEVVRLDALIRAAVYCRQHVTAGLYEDPRKTFWVEHPCAERNTIDVAADLERLSEMVT